MLEIGSIVENKYKILNIIGQGGMSIVYLAMNEKANKQWAIKEVRRDGGKNFDLVKQRLVAETDILKKLRHPNLPSIVDVIDTEDTFLIVMDYIEGVTLSRRLEEFGAQPQEQVVEWAKQICGVLEYLHTRTPPIIYRDMKPSNVMLKPSGNISIIDFGTAKEYKGRKVADTTCLGTVGYAAPEQYGDGRTDARTDIYCLGATLYHLVTGCNPSEPPYEIRPIREINPSLSKGLERIIQRCTQPDPDSRYQTCAELIYDLDHYQEEDAEFAKKQKQRLGLFLTAALLAVLCLLVGVGGNLIANRLDTEQYDELVAASTGSDAFIRSSEDFTGSTVDYRISKAVAAIDLKPTQADGYEALISAYREVREGEDSPVFDETESSQLQRIWLQNKDELQATNLPGFVNLSFEIGKLYWYYDANTDPNYRMKTARDWFKNVVDYANESYENYVMADVYYNIGQFQADVVTYDQESTGEGKYKEFWDNLCTLLDMVQTQAAENSSVSDNTIMRLELYRLLENSITSYAYNFSTDGVTEKDLTARLDQVVAAAADLHTTGDTTRVLKEEIAANEEVAQRTIDAVFPAQGRGSAAEA